MADNGMSREEAERISAPDFERYRQQYERGDPLGLIQAVRHSLMWSLPVPKWATEHALRAIESYFNENKGAPGKGKTGGLKTQWHRDRIHRARHQVADHEIARKEHGLVGGTNDDAFERASKRLAGTPAQGQPGAIKKSHAKVAKKLKPKAKP